MLTRIVIDLDETLVRSPGMRDHFGRAFAFHGLDPETALTAWDGARGGSLWELLALLGVSDEERQDLIIASMWETYDSSQVTAMPYADEFLRLAAAGANLHLSTGSDPRLAQDILDRFGWTPLFCTINGTTRRFQKGPAHLQRIAAYEGVRLDEMAGTAAFIGDGQRDMSVGADAGFQHRIGLTNNRLQTHLELLEAGATLTVPTLREAADMIKPMLRSDRLATA